MASSYQAPQNHRRLILRLDSQDNGDSGYVAPQPEFQSAQNWARAYQSSIDSNYRTARRLPTLDEILRNPPKPFQYRPLDHSQSSIRLVHLLPKLSIKGLIQCRISHASINTSYVCLSYVWNIRKQYTEFSNLGDTDERVILINSQPFLVRDNLFDFLWMARHNATRRDWTPERFDLSVLFWVDALCIDQLNVSERNHQVQQMGDIYSGALSVQVWLGKAPPLGPTACCVSGVNPMPGEERTAHLEKVLHCWTAYLSSDGSLPLQSVYEYSLALGDYIFENCYWKRAWVGQEIYLAKKLTFWVHTLPLDLQMVRQIRERIFGLFSPPGFRSRYHSGQYYMDYHYSMFQLDASLNLVTLLDQFSNKQCADPRDRVFSLLYLCPKRRPITTIDYQMPLTLLAYRVLCQHPGELCLCMTAVVESALGVKANMSGNVPSGVFDGPWVEFDMTIKDHKPITGSYVTQSVCNRAQKWIMLQLDGDGNGRSHTATYHENGPCTLRIALRSIHVLVDGRSFLCDMARSVSPLSPETKRVRIGWGNEAAIRE